MSAPGGYSYRPNVNRTITQKWKEASQVSYGGDEWGDDDDDYGYDEPAPVSAGNARHPGWQNQAQAYPANRSVTNSSPSRSAGRASFDRGDDRRNFSSGGAGFDSAYPTAQRNPFPEIHHDPEPQPQYPRHNPPLGLHTQGQGPYPPSGFRPSSRGQQQRPYAEGPYSAPGAFPHSRSNSGNRSVPPDTYQRHESPVRPDSRSSNTSGRQFPPRKSSLSQAQPPADMPVMPASAVDAPRNQGSASEEKATPSFVRPADIYKRIEQEREKERRSQESSRPSTDLNRPQTRDSSTSARSANSETKEPTAAASAEDTDSTRRLKPTLDTVVERKSEYGFDNMLKGAGPNDSSSPSEPVPQSATSDGVYRQPTNTSSVYTDRQDPVSASSVSRNVSLYDPSEEDKPVSPQRPTYQLPSIGRMSSFGTGLTGLTPTAMQGDEVTPTATSTQQPPPLAPVNNQDRSGPADPARGLGHQPSLGYRSVVHQAFDDSQNLNPRSPVSGSDTIPRSNSASTTSISPIMSRRPEQQLGGSGASVTEQTIPEEPLSSTEDSLMSDSTVTPGSTTKQSQPLPAPPAFRPGYRRDVTPPSRDNSPAQRPLSVETGTGFRSQRAVVGPHHDNSATTETPASEDDDSRGRFGRSSPIEPTSTQAQQEPVQPPHLNARTASEEYEDWQNQKKQFNSKFGFQDSNPTTPGVPSPVSRADSPPKGTVKDIRERLESNSGRSTPVSVAADERPTHQTRMQSFRPAIPGGWQSYTATPGAGTPAREDSDPFKPPTLSARHRFESSESIPTAGPWEQGRGGISNSVFAAAAAAGTALAGAFNGPAFARNTTNESQDSSDDEWDRSPVSRSPERHPSVTTHDFAMAMPKSELAPSSHAEESKPPTPLPKDTPLMESAPPTQSTDADRYTPMDETRGEYFPAPLRTSRSVDPNGTMRPPIPNVPTVTEPSSSKDNDQLQQEIVQSLTPKSSNFEGQPDHPATSEVSTRGEDDLYGSEPSSPMPNVGRSASPSSNPVHQTHPSISTVSTSSPQKPLFAHRFSWEADSAQPKVAPATPPAAKTPATQSPDTIRAPSQTSRQQSLDNTRQESHNISSPIRNVTSPVTERPTSLSNMSPAKPALTPSAGTAQDTASLRKIMNIGNHQARLDAYSQNRDQYAQSDGMLDRWIMSMKDSPEHADLFSSSGRLRPTAQSTTPSRPSPGRSMASVGGSKMMPEVGKKSMAAAGRFGGKAGGAAKGLFAKGKEKLRQASAGDKGLTSNRRKSAGPSLLEPEEPHASNRSSVLLTAPPQIPAQDLSSSPIDTGDWSMTSNKEDSTPGMNRAPSTHRLTTIEGARFVPTTERERVIPTTSTSNPTKAASYAPLSQKEPAAGPPKTLVTGVTDEGAKPHTSYDAHEKSLPNHSDRDVQSGTEPSEGYGQTGSYMPPSQRYSSITPSIQRDTESERARVDGSNHEIHEGPAHAEPGLTVPDDGRRRSIVSDVSSASPSPAKDHDGANLDRSVSPAEEHVPAQKTSSPYGVATSKVQEAMRDEAAAKDQTRDDPVPSYEEKDDGVAEPRQPRIGPGAQIVPVADLSQQKRAQVNRSSTRPFSFDGTEMLNQAQRQPSQTTTNADQLHNVPSQPLSPVSQTLSKSLSQVSAEEIGEDQNGASKRQSRSYSRPFGVDPIRDHPAHRQPTETVDRSQMYSTESPLPSARRPQVDNGRIPQRSPPVAEAEEEAYRIPGPYKQEYRSPRQNSMPKPESPSQSSTHAPPEQHGGQQQTPYQQHNQDYQQHNQDYQQHNQEQPPMPRQQPMSRPAPPEQSRSKRSAFGGLFRNRSSSRSRRGLHGETDTNQRNVLRRNSRHDSLTSQQSSLHEARDAVGQLPPSGRERRYSKNIMHTGVPTPVKQGDSGKKRFSGIFSRGSKPEKSAPQRSSTLPYKTSQPNSNINVPTNQGQAYGDPRAPTNGHFQGSAPPAGGYYAPQHEQENHWNPSSQAYPQNETPPHAQHRPADLRIDTSGAGRGTQSIPASAPPQTHANRDISYQTRQYVPSTARPPSAEPGSIPRGPSPHVVDLHKRSRSPKLGRQSEDEEHAARENGDDATGTPVGVLGTFNNKKISPVGGIPRPDEDQEAPYRIGIPGETAEDRRRTRQLMIERGSIKERERAGPSSPVNGMGNNAPTQTVAERMSGPQTADRNIPGTTSAARAPMQHAAPSAKGSGFVAELPGSKAEGYESEEDVQMSATAYPGQWQDPIYFDGGRWDD